MRVQVPLEEKLFRRFRLVASWGSESKGFSGFLLFLWWYSMAVRLCGIVHRDSRHL
jgi:hypothetical protein